MAATDVEIVLEDGPWDGMLDSIAPTSRQEGKYQLGQNLYPLDPSIGDGLVGRPGVEGVGAQLGGVGARRSQGIYQYTKKNGAEFTIAITGGKFYTLNWATDVWTEVLTTAQLTAALITLSATAKIAFLTVSDKLFVSDGTNTPWLWDGTTGAGLTKLTNCPPLYGQPDVHEARIFGIKATDLTTMVWSEADAPNTGYEAGGYNNAWTITQTDPNRLFRLVGANDGLTVMRARSTTNAGGGVGPNFSSQSTKEGVSSTDGTTSPFAVVRTGSQLIMLDADLRPQLLRAGAGGYDPLWAPLRETIKNLPRDLATCEKAMGVLYTPASLVLLAVADAGSSECNILLVYDVKGALPVAVAVWSGWEMTALGMVKSGITGAPYLMHGDSSGYIYRHGNPEDTDPWDDFLHAGTAPIEHVLVCQPLGYSVKREKIFDRIDVAIRAMTRMAVEVSATTPRGAAPSQTVVVDPEIPPAISSYWDDFLWEGVPWDRTETFTGEEAHGDCGIDLQARWIKPRLRHAVLGEQFGVVALSVSAYAVNDDPEVP